MRAIPALLLIAALNAAASAQTTALTIQGRLKSGSTISNGPHDFRFRLWDAATGGTQVGATRCLDGVPVNDGFFAANVDFGNIFATSAPRFIEVHVRPEIGQPCTDEFAYVLLGPRQQLAATPLASHTLTASSLAAPDGSPADALVVDNDGKIGIGTSAPASTLHIVGPSSALKLQDPANPANHSLFEDWTSSFSRLMKFTNVPGGCLIDFDPMPADGASPAGIEFFRQTQTTGQKAVQFYRGNGQNITDAVISVDGQNSYFQLGGGNLGIGTFSPVQRLSVVGSANFTGSVGVGTTTIAPDARLEVRGEVKFGSAGQEFVAAGQENLRVIYGTIDMFNGIVSGSGFTWQWLDDGKGRITFNSTFGGEPTVTATARRGPPGGPASDDSMVVMIDSKTSNSVVVVFRQNLQSWTSSVLDFIAVGPR